jgi:hypothetical protein
MSQIFTAHHLLYVAIVALFLAIFIGVALSEKNKGGDD